ncbi:hypothetical protein AURDEDRAFT_115423 [Auricularia subglabra TFB-10046 SS5]|nr:hypothetical protein AURDEDRAFT_115423 [Auricularia subglabra TFB-10046 SS5]
MARESYSRLLNEDDEERPSPSGSRSRSPLEYRDDEREKPIYRGAPGRTRWLNKTTTVGLVVLVLVIGIGVVSTMTGSERQWNDPSKGHASAFHNVSDILDTGVSRPPPKNSKLMTQQEWQALEDEKYNPKNYVKGPPTAKFRDNLRPDVKYMSGWIAGGWTNDFMTYINMVYIAYITKPRVPIVGQFHPTHVGEEAGFLHFGDVFDVPRLSRLLRMPVLEWRDVKAESSKEVEEIGCWSAWAISGPDEDQPRHSFIPEILNLDISYTDAPKDAKMTPWPGDWFVSFWPLAALAYPEGRKEALEEHQPRQSLLHKAAHPPDEQLVCYDFLYFAGVATQDEWFKDFSPAWREVGTHTHWAPRVQALTEGYLMRHFHVKRPEDIPLFVVVHARRNDFEGWCGDVAVKDCFASLDAYERRVKEIQAEIKKRHSVDVTTVVMTSDESDPEWWKGVRAKGWTWVDHTAEKTVEKYGKWYPVLIDAVIQSMGRGFVGTDRSTMSMVAARRVEDWEDGPYAYVRWGRPGADDH